MKATNEMISWTKNRIQTSKKQEVFAGVFEAEIAQTFNLSFPNNLKVCRDLLGRGIIRETKTPSFYLLA